jgi:pyruvate/2-oxoglutarate dehydrogenase complex dihydrolipoamide dehydrogenase (E3) component
MCAVERVTVQPMDEHNRRLVERVHPPGWTNPVPKSRYHLVVVGAGTAGLVAAAGAAGLGARVALIERHLMGGDCLNTGCVPSKAILRSAHAAAEFRNASRLGVRLGGSVTVDFAAVMERMRKLRADISHADSAERFTRECGVEVFLGNAKFTGPDTIDVDGTTLRFSRAVIATGARAATLPVEGLESAGYLTNETVFSLTSLPRRLAVIGGGPIGCELAQAFRGFGSEVTVVEAASQILGREDADAARLLQAAMESEGVRFLLGAKTRRIRVEGDEKVLDIESGEGAKTLRADEILLCVGRKPNVEGLGLEAAGVVFDPVKGVTATDDLQTANPRIFAAGDVCMAQKFTHAADFAARIVIQNALFSAGRFGRRKLSALTIPWCTYTQPEVAHVGLYEREARERGLDTQTFVQEMAQVDRAITDGDTGGFVKILAEKRSGRILGATIVARNAGDLISEVTLALTQGVTLGKIANVIHPYPTQADGIRKLGDQYNRTKLTPGVKRWMQRYFNWRY